MISQLCRRRILGCNRQYQHYQSLQNVVSSSALTNSNVNSPFQRKQYPFSSTHHHQAFHSRPAETEPASLIIDTDAGIDDAQAMYLALTHPTADIAAITVVR